MTTTDELRRMLDERGVEWEDMSARLPTGMLWCTEWTSQDGEPCTALEGADDIPDGKLSVQALLTPAQAIAATLGSDDTFTREDVEGAFVSGYSLGLDMFDNSKPDNEKGWNQNERNLDEEMEDLGWVRKDAATLSAVTCHDVGDPSDFCCSECGVRMFTESNDTYTMIDSLGNIIEQPSFCPNCGARIVEVDE